MGDVEVSHAQIETANKAFETVIQPRDGGNSSLSIPWAPARS